MKTECQKRRVVPTELLRKGVQTRCMVPTELLRKGIQTRCMVTEAGVRRVSGKGLTQEGGFQGTGPWDWPMQICPAVDQGRAEAGHMVADEQSGYLRLSQKSYL